MERVRLVDESGLNYSGPMNVQDFITKIDQLIDSLGYNKRELSFSEKIKEDGKIITLSYEPWKNVTTYAKYVMAIQFSITGIKDEHMKLDGKDYKYQTAKVSGRLSSFVETTTQWHWHTQPFYYFILGIIDKYIWHLRWYSILSNYDEQVNADLGQIKYELESFLNTYQYKAGVKQHPTVPGSILPQKIKELKG
ncbi:hypothetical protein K9M79_08490 [Candidatus Woesearchaeota archaeon]|nr:hypothetical protein [Candidatus Woesearchaeota archaeon]